MNGAEVSVNGEFVFAEGRHYGVVRAASSALLRRAV